MVVAGGWFPQEKGFLLVSRPLGSPRAEMHGGSLPQAKRVSTCSTWSHVRRGRSVSPRSLHVRNSYRPQPGAGAAPGHWELKPKRGAAPWEPGLAGRIQAHAQHREQPTSTSRDIRG